MLKHYFDQVYLINLPTRPDRLKKSRVQCAMVDLPFKVFPAVDGSRLNIQIKPYSLNDEMFWNKGAYGLLLTTMNIIQDAKRNRYKRILILEDDVEFDPLINHVFSANLKQLPTDWHMLLFGAQHCTPPAPVSGEIKRVKYAYCCHCYGINSNIFDYYLRCLDRKQKQIDLVTAEDIQPLGHTYCLSPNRAFQEKSYSNIQCRPVNYTFLRDE